jgi:uncharacterized protein YxeA
LELNSHNVVKKKSPKYDIEDDKEYIEIESDATNINENASNKGKNNCHAFFEKRGQKTQLMLQAYTHMVFPT